MKKNKKGFTLLELLVVVVIIGILAAIALPQYRKAVGKAELAQVISATKAVQNAQERFYLVNNTYTTQFSKLDIDLSNKNVSCKTFDKRFSICYNKNYVIAHYYSQVESHANEIECYARNKKLVTACESFLNKSAYESNGDNCKHMSGAKLPCYVVMDKKMPM